MGRQTEGGRRGAGALYPDGRDPWLCWHGDEVVWGQGQCKLGQGRLILLSGSMRSALCRQMLEVLLSAENNKQTHTPSFLFPSQIRSNHLLLLLFLFFRPFFLGIMFEML